MWSAALQCRAQAVTYIRVTAHTLAFYSSTKLHCATLQGWTQHNHTYAHSCNNAQGSWFCFFPASFCLVICSETETNHLEVCKNQGNVTGS